MTSSKELLEAFKFVDEGMTAVEIIREKAVDAPDLIRCFEVDGKRVEFNLNHAQHLSKREFNLLKKFLG